MRAGQTRKFHRNMEFERSARRLGVLGLSFLGLLGPVAIVILAIVGVLMLHNHGTVAMAGLGVVGLPRTERGAQRFMRERQVTRKWKGSLFDTFRHVRKLRNPNIGDVVEVITYSFYDQFSVNVNTAFPTVRMFQVPQGGSKNLAQTNLTGQGGILPNPYRFTVYGIRCDIAQNTTPADLLNITQNCTLEFYVNNKPYQQGPIKMYPSGMGPILDAITAQANNGTNNIFSTNNGSRDPRASYLLDAPVTIEQGEQFWVAITPQTGFSTNNNATNPVGVGTLVTVYLDGNLERGVS